ncbi:hypothetical protein EJ03DRAFT_223376 [Teratosphaeria nubilosa]|uniref:Uncharacterized protein n=1 Tax=Teratosphaeria nubilosa TaxID=161662 RepID=A0A6G1KWC5_9PEZI|nr:hypothetical protein EJ03DRAFT_223376 [Teratosphaeria nubilosa]
MHDVYNPCALQNIKAVLINKAHNQFLPHTNNYQSLPTTSNHENALIQRMRDLALPPSGELMHKKRQAEVAFLAEEESRIQSVVRHHAILSDSLIAKERALQADHPVELEKVTEQLKVRLPTSTFRAYSLTAVSLWKDIELDLLSLEHSARVMRKLSREASERKMELVEEMGLRMAAMDKVEYFLGLYRAVCVGNHKLERGLLGEWYAV